jgi:hypothetical protein
MSCGAGARMFRPARSAPRLKGIQQKLKARPRTTGFYKFGDVKYGPGDKLVEGLSA